jgi:hypothetical protein
MRVVAIAVAFFAITVTSAQAKTHHNRHHRHTTHHYHHRHYARHHGTHVAYHDGRPHAWCGWQMRQWMHVADTAYNLARNWAHWGRATQAHVGAVVVWPHHVGRIVGGSPGKWVVESGNDGHRVRTRARSTAGAIAFRE